MPITDSHQTPDLPESGQWDIKRIYINNTQGIWIRTNIEKQEMELWFDGQFQASWNIHDKPEKGGINANLACAMMAQCVGIGKRIRSKEFKALINA